MFQVFNTCVNTIRTIPTLVYDEKHVEDVDTDGEDHIYDQCRYVMMDHPIAPRANTIELPPSFEEDPLGLWKDRQKINGRQNIWNFYHV
jgi:hypothetical protein